MPHDRPAREHDCGSWKVPQSRVPRGLPHLPVCDVCLQHDRGNGTDTLGHHPYQVSSGPGTREPGSPHALPLPTSWVPAVLRRPERQVLVHLGSQLPRADRGPLHLTGPHKRPESVA